MTPSDLSGTLPAALDTSKPNVARAYDYLLGGKGSYAADREAVWQILWTWPEVRDMARANRAFMQQAVRFLAGEAGIRQFIDIGTGIPSAGNMHEVAGQVAPGARVVYVDNDPIVREHASRWACCWWRSCISSRRGRTRPESWPRCGTRCRPAVTLRCPTERRTSIPGCCRGGRHGLRACHRPARAAHLRAGLGVLRRLCCPVAR